MTILEDTYTLTGGAEIPRLGIGTWFIDDDKAAGAVRSAIEIGCRHIDTAQTYGNERGVGEGVRTAGVPREELFVSTKIAAEVKDYESAVAPIQGSLETMGLEYIDLMLVHAGNTPRDLLEFCEEKDIRDQAYSPIAHGAILENPDVQTTAERYGVSVPQLCIRYTLQLGTVSLPKTANPEHMRANAQVDFEISAEDMAALEGLDARDYGEHAAFPVFSGK